MNITRHTDITTQDQLKALRDEFYPLKRAEQKRYWDGVQALRDEATAKTGNDTIGYIGDEPFVISHIARAAKLDKIEWHLDRAASTFRKVEKIATRAAREATQATRKARKISDRKEVTKTCQICGRGIKHLTGVVAHHGYKRPQGWGTQTSSCFGARHVGFEISRDALGQYNTMGRAQQVRDTEALEDFQTNPPATLTTRPLYYSDKAETFEAGTIKYKNLHHVRVCNMISDLRFLNADLTRQQARFDAWKPQA